MIPYLREAIGGLAGAALAVVVCLVVYEGIPLGPLRLIPGIDQFAEGRVAAERRKAREGFVQEAQLIAAEAKLAETQRQLAAGRKALDAYAAMLSEAQAREAALAEQDAKDEAEYEALLKAAGRSCALGSDDVIWLRK